MKRAFLALSVVLAASSAAQAFTIDASIAQPANSSLLLKDVELQAIEPIKLTFGAARNYTTFGVARVAALPPMGDSSLSSQVWFGYQNAALWSSQASGVLGSVALKGTLEFWKGQVGNLDPFAVNAADPVLNTDSGSRARIEARYRLQRDLTLQAQAALGTEEHLDVQVQYQPQDQNNSVRAGIVSAAGSIGVLLGGTWKPDDNWIFNLDALLGVHDPLGWRASIAAYGLPFDSNVQLYSQFEPWRTATYANRLGVQWEVPLQESSVLVNFATAGNSSSFKMTYHIDR